MALDFAEPRCLWLLALLPAFAWWLRRAVAARSRRGATAVGLRLLVLAALLLALARPRAIDEVRRLAVAFLVDVSESIPLARRDAALRRIEADLERMPADDQATLIVFADRPSVELPLAGPRARAGGEGMVARLDHLESRVNRSSSDLAGAVTFAQGVLPGDVAQRIVLVSDGNQTRGDLRGAAAALRAGGVQLDVRSILYRFDEEVMVEGLYAPERAPLGEPMQLRAVVSAQAATDAEIWLSQDGTPATQPQAVHLVRGSNAMRFSLTPTTNGVHQYEVEVRAARDGNPANNVGRAGVVVGGLPRVVVVAEDGYEERIADILEQSGSFVQRLRPVDLPSHPAGHVGVDSVVLNNVPAYALSAAQLAALKDGVMELGVGLVTIGGDHAFGPGGYRGTPLADLLPIDLDTANVKTMPKGALVIVLHSIEFDSGNTWAERICNSAIGGMRAGDEAGVVHYDHAKGENWLFELQPIGDGQAMKRLIAGVFVGDMPSFHNCFVLAEESLARSDAAAKHIVIISDGDPQLPAPDLVARLVADRVTISAIIIEPHGVASIPMMQDLVQRGGGRFHQLVPSRGDLQLLPRLMLKEVATLRRSSLKEERFTPVVALAGSPLLRGTEAGFPSLNGYVVGSARAGAETVLLADAESGDPLLAAWYAGLGRSIAFTSDATSRWAGEWLGWPRFAPFFAQLVRASATQGEEDAYPVRVVQDGLGFTVSVQANDVDGNPITDLAVRGSALGRSSEPVHFDLRQDVAGGYSARVEVADPGHYLLQLHYERGDHRGRMVAAAAIDFAPEYRSLQSREDVLRDAARSTGGHELADGDDPFAHDFVAVRGAVELWPWLVVAAMIALVGEIVVRRIDLGQARARPAARTQRSDAVASPAPGPAVAPDLPIAPPAASSPPVAKPDPASRATLDELNEARQRAARRREWK